MIIPDWKIEEKLKKEGWDFVVGIDEAGRGPLAGPVVASAVVFRNSQILNKKNSGSRIVRNFNSSQTQKEFLTFHHGGLIAEMTEKRGMKDSLWDLVRDSKTLSEKQKERAYKFVKKNFIVGVGICDEKTIDRVNILEASFLAMKMAVTDLKKQLQNLGDKKYKILVDGNKKIPNFSEEQEAIVQGDKKVKSIAAASIIAKVTRDEIMKKYDEKYPEYKFAQHKGYGTKIHMEALQKYGACEIHRQSFKPVKKLAKMQK